MDTLARRSVVGLAQFIGALGILIFVPAWTLDFWQAWVYLFVFAVSAALITLYLWRKDPKLLERRLAVGPGAEKEKSQKRIQSFATAAFIGTFLLPSLDHRFSWSKVPFSIVIVADFLVAIGFFIVFLVFKENTIAPGPSRWPLTRRSFQPDRMRGSPSDVFGRAHNAFRHAIRAGSWWGLAMFIPMTLVIVWRLLDEEKFLLKNLPGYRSIMKKSAVACCLCVVMMTSPAIVLQAVYPIGYSESCGQPFSKRAPAGRLCGNYILDLAKPERTRLFEALDRIERYGFKAARIQFRQIEGKFGK